ncbi:MAG: phosphoenolpyruvate carboxykinase (ATP) [candidate division Zixibacteria bacterium]|nr:phosphoenolpyruvate carboxykinase (ATP) [candidate division Zixibacteria bacterium]
MTNKIQSLQSPAQNDAETRKSQYKLEFHGLTNLKQIYWNLPTSSLYEEAVFRGEGIALQDGPLVVSSGKNTTHALNDTYIVKTVENENRVWWGEHNRPFSEQSFEGVYNRIKAYLQGQDVFVQDCFAGTEANYRLPVRVITENAWHSLFARNSLLQPENNDDYSEFIPEFTIIHVPYFKGIPEIDSTRSDAFVLMSFDLKLCLIGGTGYSGEIKKSVFTYMNYILSNQDVLTMHCSANKGTDDKTALFFGNSGTGKTALAVDTHRALIGDDEIAWGAEGIFNLEGGCYAKVLNLSEKNEAQVFACTKKTGTILENVICDPTSCKIDLNDNSRTDNTRASFPLHYIANAESDAKGEHPKNIIMLTCDATGVIPPIAKLTNDQAMYYFLSGCSFSGMNDETDSEKEPDIVFSPCFGAPFMDRHPYQYAEMLKNKIARHGTNCWMINTGIIGGPSSSGKRMSIQLARTLSSAAINGDLDDVEYLQDPVFGFKFPKSCGDLTEKDLNPELAWNDANEYSDKRNHLAQLFIENFKKFAGKTPDEVVIAGPKKLEK